MKILITGGAGMVGSHCAEYFAKKKNQVIVYDNLMRSQIFSSNKKSVEWNWNYLKQFKNIKLIKKDIRDIDSLHKCFRLFKPDVVIHAAAQPGVRFSLDNPYEDHDVNSLGTVNVLEALRIYNPKGTFIYCSTNKVYGGNVSCIPLKESKMRYDFKNLSGVKETQSIDLTGHTPYGVSKLSGDIYVQDYAQTYGLKTGVFRMSCVYGTRQFGFEDQGWISWFSSQAIKGNEITIYGDGKQVRDVLWVEDLVLAFDRFIKSKETYGVYNIGGGRSNTLSLLELIEILQEIVSKKILLRFDDWRKFDYKVYISDIDKVQKVLQWNPKVSPDTGIKRIVKWIRNNPDLFK